MARRKTNPLDATLANFEQAILAISKVVKLDSKDLESGQYEIPVLINAAEKYARTLTMLIDAAPFLQAKQRIESMEEFKAWIQDSVDFVGDNRDIILQAAEQFEESVLKTTGHYTPATQLRMF